MFLTFLQLKMDWDVSVLRPNVEKKKNLRTDVYFSFTGF